MHSLPCFLARSLIHLHRLNMNGWSVSAELGGGQIDEDCCALFARLALQKPTLPAPRFSALIDDFGLLARGAATSDVLLAYEL